MTTLLTRPSPPLHHSVSLNHLQISTLLPLAIAPATYSLPTRTSGSVTFKEQAIPRRIDPQSLPYREADLVEVVDRDRAKSWRLKRKMSTPSILRASPNRQMDPNQTLHSPTSVRPATRTRLSLSNLITSSSLLRRLSSSPTSPPHTTHTPRRPATSIATGSPSSLHGDRRTPVRSSTLPSFPTLSSVPMFDSSWALIEDSETLTEEPDEFPHPSLVSPQPHQVAAHQRMNPSSPYLSRLNTSIVDNISSPTSPSPSQGVWLCTPPKPTPSPTLDNSKRRPAYTTTAMSTSRAASAVDEDEAIMHLSAHSERVLATSSVVQGASCWREKYTCCPFSKGGSRANMRSGLLRSQSAAQLGQMGDGRPSALGADSTGHTRRVQFLTLANGSAREEKENSERESESKSPFMEEANEVDHFEE